ncbi:MAG: VanZ family protein [Gammaproteobacteria bacterium]|nr:VanZ family protein [Gammaproteobacteria bacterium]MCW8841540.1 VanZ family protein [Gammaproteobacteria bacterium]MCW8971857.1 VanZ family protein [Gammaproteobacteria bacterium]MCW8994140.1 VanZ family protein [Gammaproteobacteria bacterium]
MRDFRYPKTWLILGWSGIGLLVWFSLASLTLHIDVEYGDKWMHLLTYALLMGWFVQLYSRWPLILLHALLLMLLGVMLEFLQTQTGRHFEVADMLANTLGVTLGGITVLTPLRDRLLWLERKLFV